MIGEVTNHLWQSTWFAVAAGLLAVALRRNRAQVRFWLWFSASAKFLVPFALSMGLGSQLHWMPARKIAAQIAAPAVSIAMEQIAEPFSRTTPIAQSAQGTADWFPMAILAVWACGFVTIALFRFRAWLRIRSALRGAVRGADSHVCSVESRLDVLRLPAQIRERKAPSLPLELRLSPALLEPGVVGIFRPILLLPAGIEDRLTPPQLEAVLAHELCHIRRRDNLFSAIHMIVEAVFWFHPLVWWIGARLVEERERACDEEVLRLGSDPRVYAEGILKVCKLYVESPLVCVSGVTGADLKKRIEAIMANRITLRLHAAKKAALAFAGIAALTLPIAIGILHTPTTRAQSPAPAAPKFEVASIKPCKAGDLGGGRKSGNTKAGGGAPASSPGRLTTACDTVETLIRSAYVMCASGTCLRDPSAPPVEGGPAWIRSESYQINARAEGSPSEGLMMGPMMQTLLEDRFQLKIHRESREVPIYAVTVAKGGLKVKPFQEGSCIPRDIPFRPPTPEERSQNYCMTPRIGFKGPNFSIEAAGTTLDSLFKVLYVLMDRPVIDKTGITGGFDISTGEFARPEGTPVWRPLGEAAPPPTPPADPSDEIAGPSIFTVFEKQLGLKIEPAKGPRDYFVIDSFQKPSGN